MGGGVGEKECFSKPSNNLKNVLSVTAMLILSKGLDVNPNNLWSQSNKSWEKEKKKRRGVFVVRE